MPTVVVERSFEHPVTFAELQARETAAAWCLELHNVRFCCTYLSKDGRRMICVYDAPDAESVRESQRTAGLPFDRVWTADEHGPGVAPGDSKP